MPGRVPGTKGTTVRMMVASHHLGANVERASESTESLRILNCRGRNQLGSNWNSGGVESTGTPVQVEWSRRPSEAVTSAPRPKRWEPWREEHLCRGVSRAKVPWRDGASGLDCVRSRKESLLRNACLGRLRAVCPGRCRQAGAHVDVNST